MGNYVLIQINRKTSLCESIEIALGLTKPISAQNTNINDDEILAVIVTNII